MHIYSKKISTDGFQFWCEHNKPKKLFSYFANVVIIIYLVLHMCYIVHSITALYSIESPKLQQDIEVLE